VKQRCYLPENPYFYDYLTGWEFLQMAAGLFQSTAVQRQRIPQLELVGYRNQLPVKKQLRQYSKGCSSVSAWHSFNQRPRIVSG